MSANNESRDATTLGWGADVAAVAVASGIPGTAISVAMMLLARFGVGGKSGVDAIDHMAKCAKDNLELQMMSKSSSKAKH